MGGGTQTRAGSGITKSREIRSLFATGHRVRVRSLSFVFRETGERPRRGVVVSGKIRGAVVRNRVKRRIREVLRSHPEILPVPVDVIIRAREGSETLASAELKGIIEQGAGRITRRMAPTPGRGQEGGPG